MGTVRKSINRSDFNDGNLATEGNPVLMKNIGRSNVGYGRVVNPDQITDGNGYGVSFIILKYKIFIDCGMVV